MLELRGTGTANVGNFTQEPDGSFSVTKSPIGNKKAKM